MQFLESNLKTTLCLLLAVVLTGCCRLPPSDYVAPNHDLSKVQFSLDVIRPDGLRGAPDGLTSVAYEFCVPTNEAIYEEIRRIDPSVKFHKSSPGRIGCSKQETLCIGETHQSKWKEKIFAISALPYVDEIRECYFE